MKDFSLSYIDEVKAEKEITQFNFTIWVLSPGIPKLSSSSTLAPGFAGSRTEIRFECVSSSTSCSLYTVGLLLLLATVLDANLKPSIGHMSMTAATPKYQACHLK